MSKTDAIGPGAGQIEAAAPATLALKAAAARAALGDMRKRADDLSRQARSRARALSRDARRRAQGEITRRRASAADTLENLASTLRPQDKVRARRRTAAIAGGSTLALAAALGAGVAIGMYLARRLQTKKEAAAADAPGAPEAQPVSAASGAERPAPPPVV